MITSEYLDKLRMYARSSDEDGSWRSFGTGYPVPVGVLRTAGASSEVLREIYEKWWSKVPVEDDMVHVFQCCLCVVNSDCKEIVKKGFIS